ncbi:hypothetical protein NDU88_003440 [Pleurodeles waltl]|uniref:Uncharacterized protein n=1 Tax=Pleurodeles waltl TaxID=8319 RepID=A0AAV7W6W9_PLEWA|nr:hypothetical protein NDU88_003440 [Pleurodeles waltl]
MSKTVQRDRRCGGGEKKPDSVQVPRGDKKGMSVDDLQVICCVSFSVGNIPVVKATLGLKSFGKDMGIQADVVGDKTVMEFVTKLEEVGTAKSVERREDALRFIMKQTDAGLSAVNISGKMLGISFYSKYFYGYDPMEGVIANREPKDLRSAAEHPDIVRKKVKREKDLGRALRYFNYLPEPWFSLTRTNIVLISLSQKEQAFLWGYGRDRLNQYHFGLAG